MIVMNEGECVGAWVHVHPRTDTDTHRHMWVHVETWHKCGWKASVEEHVLWHPKIETWGFLPWRYPVAGPRVGLGWVQTHPLSKKAPMRFSQIRKLFWGDGGGGVGGVGLREKKHELCQIVLNKQQHLHNAIYSIDVKNVETNNKKR